MKLVRYALTLALLAITANALAQAPAGLIIVESQNDIDTTQAKLEAAIEGIDGLNIMTIIDHAANAERAGLELRPTRLVIFGNPNAGTPLMQAAQSVAIDLPQKMLIWEDASGAVFVGYNSPYYLKARHMMEGEDGRIGNISKALSNLANAATTP